MGRSPAILLILLLVSGPSRAISQTSMNPAGLVQECGPSVVTIAAYSATGNLIHFGSGFFLPDGRIVTTAHVLSAAARLEVADWEGNVLGDVSYAEALSVADDLSILPGPGSPRPGLTLSTSIPAIGSPVAVLGSERGLEGRVSEAVVQTAGKTEAQYIIQISGSLPEGLLGGPVLDLRGEVIGAAVAIPAGRSDRSSVVPSAVVAALAAVPAGALSFPRESPGIPGLEGDKLGSEGDFVIQEQIPKIFAEAGPLVFGETAGGILTTGDVRVKGRGAFDFFRFQGLAGTAITISSRSLGGTLDLFLQLLPPSCISGLTCARVAVDDNSGEGMHAQLSLRLPEDGGYLVGVGSPEGKTGSYTILLSPGLTSPVVEAIPAGRSGAEALPDRWVRLGEGEKFTIFLDTASVSLSESVVRAWFSWRYRELQKDDQGTYESQEMFLGIRCGSNEMRVLRVDRILGEDRRTSVDSPGEWTYVSPGSIGSAQITAACVRAYRR